MTKNNNILPEGWKTKPINQVFEFIGTSSYSRNDINYEIDKESIYYIHYGDIHATYKNAVLDFDTETRIPVLKKHIKPSTNFLKEGDLIIADASEDYEGVGEALEVYNIEDKKVLAGLHTFALRDKNNETAHGYRAYLFKNPEVKKRLKTIATGSKVYGISKGNLEKFKIILPSLPEQQKIAQILATWDKAIKLQQQLIDNKKQYKKAVMKKLLTGEVRFKGFSEKWKEYHLGFLGNTYSGLSGKSKEDFGIGLPYIPYKNIYGNPSIDITYMDYVNIKPSENQNKVIYGDIFFTVSSETPDEVGMSSVLLDKSIEELYLNSFCFGFRLNDFKTLLPEFASHYFRGDKFRFEMLKAAQGATRFNLSKSNVTKLKIVIPSVAEQLKIASFLSGIDKETKALENELLYFQKQKQGLMQQLLTGKLRVEN